MGMQPFLDAVANANKGLHAPLREESTGPTAKEKTLLESPIGSHGEPQYPNKT